MNRRAEAGFTEFAESSQLRLRRAAYLLCGDWDLAADLVQDCLIRVYVAWPRLTRQGHEYGYARKALVSVFLDRRRRRSSGELPMADDPTRASGEDVAGAVSDRRTLMAALAQLGSRQRACVVLRYFEDLDVRATAAVLGCSEGTVKSQTSRALDTLRTVLDVDELEGVRR